MLSPSLKLNSSWLAVRAIRPLTSGGWQQLFMNACLCTGPWRIWYEECKTVMLVINEGSSHELLYLLSSATQYPTETLTTQRIQIHSFSTAFISYSQRLENGHKHLNTRTSPSWRGSHWLNSRPPSSPKMHTVSVMVVTFKVEIVVSIHWMGWHAGSY